MQENKQTKSNKTREGQASHVRKEQPAALTAELTLAISALVPTPHVIEVDTFIKTEPPQKANSRASFLKRTSTVVLCGLLCQITRKKFWQGPETTLDFSLQHIFKPNHPVLQAPLICSPFFCVLPRIAWPKAQPRD